MPPPPPPDSPFQPLGSRSAYRDLIELVPEATLLIGAGSGVVIDANGAALRLFGQTLDGLLGMNVDALCPPTQPDGGRSSDLWTQSLEQARSEGERHAVWDQHGADGAPLTCTVRLRRMGAAADGGLISAGFEPLADHGRAPYERDLMARALMESPVAVLALRLDGTFRLCNEAACRALGFNLDELDGLSIEQVDEGWRRQLAEPGASEALSRGQVLRFESHHRRRDGGRTPVRVAAFRVRHGEEDLVFGFVEPLPAAH